jgi:hypothetical protein
LLLEICLLPKPVRGSLLYVCKQATWPLHDHPWISILRAFSLAFKKKPVKYSLNKIITNHSEQYICMFLQNHEFLGKFQSKEIFMTATGQIIIKWKKKSGQRHTDKCEWLMLRCIVTWTMNQLVCPRTFRTCIVLWSFLKRGLEMGVTPT